ncbi:integrase core domain-containing protein [Kitasatospora sp. NPDC057940]|uniref:integrase core domain-containing protein n=1 Tax=Kitasatospora sp. NPDC057940 TaxID=3346285 RepID=UPI0036D96631
MESTIGPFKTELINPRQSWHTLSQVKLATAAEWADWYSHRRIHGEIGHVPPVKFENTLRSLSNPGKFIRAAHPEKDTRLDGMNSDERTQFSLP